MYEALHKLAWQHFLEPYTDVEALLELSDCMDALSINTTCNIFSEILHNPAYENVLGEFEKFFHFLRNHNRSLSQFWISYMDIVDIVLNVLRTSQEGDWKLHLASVRVTIPWCFTCDCIRLWFRQVCQLGLQLFKTL